MTAADETKNTFMPKAIESCKSRKEQPFFIFALSFLLSFRSLNYFINSLFATGLHINFSFSPIFYGVAALLGIVSYFYICFKRDLLSVVLCSFALYGTLSFFVIYPSFIEAIYTSPLDLAYSPVNILFLYCLPVLNYFRLVKNKNSIVASMLPWSLAILVLSSLSYFVFSIGKAHNDAAYMLISYGMLPYSCLCFLYPCGGNSLFRRLAVKLISIASFFIVVLSGSRGAMVCSIVFFVLLLFYKRINGLRILCFFLIVILATLAFTRATFFLEPLNQILTANGIYSRTIIKALEGLLFNSSDRADLYSVLWNGALESPLFGHGLWGDRVLLNSAFSHNVFLEFLSSFGLFFGFALIVWLVVSLTKSLFELDGVLRPLLFSAIPYGFVSLFFSGSFLNNEWFFVLVGLFFLKDKALVEREFNTEWRPLIWKK